MMTGIKHTGGALSMARLCWKMEWRIFFVGWNVILTFALFLRYKRNGEKEQG
jgi:hypothetical protein